MKAYCVKDKNDFEPYDFVIRIESVEDRALIGGILKSAQEYWFNKRDETGSERVIDEISHLRDVLYLKINKT